MSEFLKAIASSEDDLAQKRSLSRNPFKDIVQMRGQGTMLFGVKCNATYVDAHSIKKLSKVLEYVHIGDISPRLSSRSWFSVGCVCGTKSGSLIISDLRIAKIRLICDGVEGVKKGDVIAFANCEVGNVVRARNPSQVIKIGVNAHVMPCVKACDDDRCSGFVDVSQCSACDFHCKDIYMDNSSSRAVLRQESDSIESLRAEEENGGSILDRKPLAALPSDFQTKYINSHPYGRSVKILQAMKIDDTPIIGKGFKCGDMIPL